MTETVITTKPMSAWKIRLIGALATGSGLFAVVSAGDLDEAISPILTQVTALFPYIVTLVTAAVPVIILLALVGFLVGLFDSILGRIKM